MVQSSWVVVPQYKIGSKSFNAQAVLLIDAEGVPIPSGSSLDPIHVQAGAGSAEIEATPTAADHLVLSTSPCDLYSMVCLPAVDGYLMLFDQAIKPSDGTVEPKYVGRVYGDAGRDFAWPTALNFPTACVAVFSTTGPFTLTAASAFLAGQST